MSLRYLNKYLEKLMQPRSDSFSINKGDYSKQLYVSLAYETISGRSRRSLYEFPES
jgi:hypothetical protein